MWQLFQFPLCPFSRKVRLVLAEKTVGHALVRENPWERRDEFMDLNPAGETPVMVEPDQGVTLIGSQPIVEYFDETVDRMPMINGNASLRAEIRRMTEGFDLKLFPEVVEPLVNASLPLPPALAQMLDRPSRFEPLAADEAAFAALLRAW